MAAKKKLQPVQRKPEPAKKKSSSWFVPAAVALVCAGIFYWAMFGSGAPATQPGASSAGAAEASGPVASMTPAVTGDVVPAFFSSAEAAKPYPTTLPPEQFPNPVVAHAYSIARIIPGVLAQEPCYCFCSKTAGHRGLLDCWADLHGSACSICIQEALYTEKLTKAGRTPAQIREAIIEGMWRTVEFN
jgi:hypothetical protein